MDILNIETEGKRIKISFGENEVDFVVYLTREDVEQIVRCAKAAKVKRKGGFIQPFFSHPITLANTLTGKNY